MREKLPHFTLAKMSPAVPASAALLFLALIYLAWKSVLSPDQESDFRSLWLAGHLWASGIDPYSPRYAIMGREIFNSGNSVASWFYPPQWWALCRPLALLPIDQALIVWRGLNALILMGSGAVLVSSIPRAYEPLPLWGGMLFLALLPLMEATPQTLAMGQTSILVFAGFCLVSRALMVSSEKAMVAGLLLLFLKPQFGAAVLIPLVLMLRWWRTLLIAATISLASALPQLLTHGIDQTAIGLLRNLGSYSELPPNQPLKLTGLTQLIARFTGHGPPAALNIALAALTGVAMILLLRRTAWEERRQGAAAGLALAGAAMFFLPLHTYDFIALAPAALLVLPFGWPARLLVWAGLLLAVRSGPLAALVADRDAGSVLILTLAGTCVALGALTALLTNHHEIEGRSGDQAAC